MMLLRRFPLETRGCFLLIAASLLQGCSQASFSPDPNGNYDISSIGATPVCRDVAAFQVKPRVKWDWYKNLDKTLLESHHRFSQVMSTPMVKDLNKDRIPEVVFTTFSIHAVDHVSSTASSYGQNGVLRIVDGRNGRTLKSIQDLSIAPLGTGTPLLVDLDEDGFFEIVYYHYSGSHLIALNHDGSLRWKHQLESRVSPSSEIATVFDMNRRRRLLISGTLVLTEGPGRKLEKLGTLPASSSNLTAFVFPMDSKNPHDVSVVNATGVYDLRSFQKRFSFPRSSLVAVGELDASEPGFEIAGTGGGHLWVMNGLSGKMLFDRDLSAFNQLVCTGKGIGGGAPTLGNFDQDPETIEIAMATGRYLSIFSAKGELIAQVETQDCSSLVTGISSFDFNGDGVQEIVYSDEEYLRIYELRDGVLRQVWRVPNPSGTLYEYPVVVDVDGNGSAELVVASNNYPVGSFYRDPGEEGDKAAAYDVTGVRAFESSTPQAWMPTRPSWPQYSFNPVMEAMKQSAPTLTALLEGFLGKIFRQNAPLSASQTGCRPQ